MTAKNTEDWPSFQPHPDDKAYCYICGQLWGNHGESPAKHCPPAVLRPRPPQSSVSKNHDAQIERLRQLARDVREGAADLETKLGRGTTAHGLALMTTGAEILDIADELAEVVKAYPHPGVADQAFAVVTEHIVKILYGPGGVADHDIQTLLLYSIAAKAQNAGMQTMIGSALTAFAGSALAAGIGEAGRRAAREEILEQAGTKVPRDKKH